MGYILKSTPTGFRATATCDHAGGCAAALERTKRTKAEATVELVYALPGAGWSDDGFPHAIYCRDHKAEGAAAREAARRALVRSGYCQLRRLNAELGVTVAEEERIGAPSAAFAGCSRVLRSAARRERGRRRLDLGEIAEALSGLAVLAEGLTWEEVRGAAGTA